MESIARRGGVCEMPQQRLCRKLRQHVPADTQQRLQETENPHRKSYTNYNRLDGKYPGHKVQVDIKYVLAIILEVFYHL